MRCAACNYSDEGYEGKLKAQPFIPVRGEQLGTEVVTWRDGWTGTGEISNPPSLFACPVCGTVKVSKDWLNEVRRSKGEQS